MRLVAIYSVWDDYDLLTHSLRNIEPLVDGIIIVASEKSNFGEISKIQPFNWAITIYEPTPGRSARENETAKRNYGLELAKRAGYTHFLTMDADELYEPEPFLKAKELFKNPDLAGLVCLCQTYFKSPKLTIGLDTTLVPFIHKLTPHIKHGFNRAYPFAWEGHNIRIDPTRSLNIHSGVQKIDLIMHHYSWVRKDYQKKIRNSTARTNLEKSCILNDLENAGPGVFCNYYQKTLIECENTFNLPVWEYSKLSEKE